MTEARLSMAIVTNGGGVEYILELASGMWSFVATRDLVTIPVGAGGRFVPPSGIAVEAIRTAHRVAGGGEILERPPSETAAALEWTLSFPSSIAVDDGNIYIASGRQVFKIGAETGLIDRISGTGQHGTEGDGESALLARHAELTGIAIDGAGNVFVLDSGRVRRIEAETGLIDTVGGKMLDFSAWRGLCGGSPRRCDDGADGGPATEARFYWPLGLAADSAGNVYVADTGSDRVRRIDAATGVVETVAGTGERGFSGDGGPAVGARLNSPGDVAVDGAGNLYVADTRNHRIRRVDAATGVIRTVAGNGEPALGGDGGPAVQAQVWWPRNVAVDGAGNFYMESPFGCCLRMVDAATGLIDTVASDRSAGVNEAVATGVGHFPFRAEEEPAPTGDMWLITDFAADKTGSMFVVGASPYTGAEHASLYRLDSSVAAKIPLVSYGAEIGQAMLTVSDDGLLRLDGRLVARNLRYVVDGRQFQFVGISDERVAAVPRSLDWWRRCPTAESGLDADRRPSHARKPAGRRRQRPCHE